MARHFLADQRVQRHQGSLERMNVHPLHNLGVSVGCHLAHTVDDDVVGAESQPQDRTTPRPNMATNPMELTRGWWT